MMALKFNQENKKRLRVGIMCSGTRFPEWEARCIRSLLSVAGVEPALLIVDDGPSLRPSFKQRVRSLITGRTLAWRVYQRAVLNRRSFSTRQVDLSEELIQVPIMRCRAERIGRYTQRFSSADISALQKFDLDVIIRFAFNILRGDILGVARYGIWSFHHGDPEKYRGTPPGFWEIYNRDPITGAVLQRLTERLDAGVILYRGFFATNASSYTRSRDELFFGGIDWPARVCKDIQNGTAHYFDSSPSTTKAPIYHDPTSLQMLRFSWISAQAWLRSQVNSLFRHQQWSIAVIDAPTPELLGLPGVCRRDNLLPSARWLPEPPGRFLADPFAVERHAGHKAGLTILVEDYDWADGRGRISAIESKDAQTFEEPQHVFELPHHMSYPTLFEHDQQLYCVPETHEANEVSLYRMYGLTEWVKVATLLKGFPAVDPTLFWHQERWWLFCTNQDTGPNTNLLAWYAIDLTGPWTAHSANPLKTDVRSSRPAGIPFVHAGQLYRPSQDCSTGYGAAVVVNRVDCLTPQKFVEEPVAVLRPHRDGPYPDGLHTISTVGDKTIIDGSRRKFVPQAFRHSLMRKRDRFRKALLDRTRLFKHRAGN